MYKFTMLFGLIMFQITQCPPQADAKQNYNQKQESIKSYLAKRVAAAMVIGYSIDCANTKENNHFFTVAIPTVYLLHTLDKILDHRNDEYR